MSYKAVLDILAGCKGAIGKLLDQPDQEHHRLKLMNDLERDIQYVSLITNTENVHEQRRTKMTKATTILGKPIVVNKKLSKEDLAPNQQRLQNLKDKVEAAYVRFANMESKFIKNEFEDNVIRGVAKKAKMRVTKEDPEEITMQFIDEIKVNIEKMNERAALKLQEKQEDELGFSGTGTKIPGVDDGPPQPRILGQKSTEEINQNATGNKVVATEVNKEVEEKVKDNQGKTT